MDSLEVLVRIFDTHISSIIIIIACPHKASIRQHFPHALQHLLGPYIISFTTPFIFTSTVSGTATSHLSSSVRLPASFC